jgi:hypothetical protein
MSLLSDVRSDLEDTLDALRAGEWLMNSLKKMLKEIADSSKQLAIYDEYIDNILVRLSLCHETRRSCDHICVFSTSSDAPGKVIYDEGELVCRASGDIIKLQQIARTKISAYCIKNQVKLKAAK